MPTNQDSEYLKKLDNYELPPHIDVDYSKAKPNRFAGKVIFTPRDIPSKPKTKRKTRRIVSLKTASIIGLALGTASVARRIADKSTPYIAKRATKALKKTPATIRKRNSKPR